ncbi:hypothetical protein AA0312_2763 [Acetobacter tropicalis NRIC 0312]|uniref:Uncharacterized protein n=1 Tax=Acetobacter tropicalis TaxID=104102 RepID=A0A511FSB6_9PROT|nr:hypothetical protein [Acetobacter tropicalis]KXV51197.1 hypothetical protein AD944_02645 [Acetobacter tropicalis]GAL97027.1 hypothetical protein ATR1_057c0013 [Acetobacter tropicalis]GBR72166.1 hypothetical protein AA0312_2763 [Acetobacter tropicalis NRIC 0312]GEL51805.1 hypothetical protein ATR01nite_28800 [Acetobacter tropicalis]
MTHTKVAEHTAANDNLTPEGAEKAVQKAVFTVASLIGRRMAREHFATLSAANDNGPSNAKDQAKKVRIEGDCT